MTLDEFTDITMAVLEEHGVADYAPTLVVQDMIQVVQGIPRDMDHRIVIQDVIHRAGLEGTELLFGVKSGLGEVTTGHYSREGTSFQRISQVAQWYTVATVDTCEWWTLGSGTNH